ncbi:MAG: hypothetical protein JXR76_00035 [Deltaproteobacteria bacterium]|nr:hypothetical protein [Deltaproteobacteria bacterium]
MRAVISVWILGGLLAAGCTSSLVTLDSSGLKYTRNNINIDFTNAESSRFIGDNWEVDNWEYNNTSHKWKRKGGSKYKGTVEYLDDDGDVINSEEYYTELTLRHRRNDSQIYVDLTIMQDSKSEIDVDVFLSNFVERLSGKTTWYKFSEYGHHFNDSRTYASKITRQQKIKIGSYDAILATIELANLEQLKLDENSRSEKVSVLLVKIPEFATDKVTSPANPKAGIEIQYELKSAVLAVVLSARPVDHDSVYRDFVAFLEHINFNGVRLKQLEAPSSSPKPVTNAPVAEVESTPVAEVESAPVAESESAMEPEPETITEEKNETVAGTQVESEPLVHAQ